MLDLFIFIVILSFYLCYQFAIGITLYEHSRNVTYKEINKRKYYIIFIILFILNGPLVWISVILYYLLSYALTIVYNLVNKYINYYKQH